MLPIPNAILSAYVAVLKKRNIPLKEHSNYMKWLRYYLDFCSKHHESQDKSAQTKLFSTKLMEKYQTEDQRTQADHAVSLYIEMSEQVPEAVADIAAESCYLIPDSARTDSHRKSQYLEAGYEVKSDSPEWDEALAALAAEIKVRHYSRKTLRTYANWSRRFQRFLKHKPPAQLSTADVKDYLTFLAVKCHVAASTQNQALKSG